MQDAQELLGRAASQGELLGREASQEWKDMQSCTLPPDSAAASPVPRPVGEPDQASPSGASDAPNEDGAARERQRRRTEQGVTDMEDLGGGLHGPVGPHYGRSAVWDGGTAAHARTVQRPLPFQDAPAADGQGAAVALGEEVEATPGRGMGIFEGMSQEDDGVDWGALGTLRKGTPEAERARQIRRRSLPVAMALDLVQPEQQAHDEAAAAGAAGEGDLQQQQQQDTRMPDIPQVDGAADTSDTDAEVPELEEQQGSMGTSRALSGRVGSQKGRRGGNSQGGSSQQRYAQLPVARACLSSASAPAAPQRRRDLSGMQHAAPPPVLHPWQSFPFRKSPV